MSNIICRNDSLDMAVVEATSMTAEDMKMLSLIKLVGVTLDKHYPCHWWMVSWAPGGVIIIKHAEGDPRFGHTIAADKSYSSSNLEHEAMVGGGDLLEQMRLTRGARNFAETPCEYEDRVRFLKPR